MKAHLLKVWESRAPRERKFIATLAIGLAIVLFIWFVHSAEQARGPLRTSVISLRAQAARLDRQALEYEQLRAVPATTASRTDLQTLVQSRLADTGLAHALVRIEATDAHQVVVVFGAVAFSDWLNWIDGLKSQQVRVDACRIEVLSTPGLVSVTATLVRPGPR